ncbi:MAG: DNA recombination protein RmuC, partial [bacterium]|nr:DNA recombination protein RmuC [bacterium]
MQFALVALLAALAGGLAAYLLARTQRRALEHELETARRNASIKSETLARAEAERDATAGQLKQLIADRESLKETFAAISSEQLKANRDELLKQAGERFEKTEERHKNELQKRHEAIETQFKGMGDSLDKFRELQRKIEEDRTNDFGMLRQRLKTLHEQTESLGKSTTGLSTALKGSSQSRGRWGEMALRNIVEAAGMTEHCDFIEQTADESGARPDLVVKLPGKTRIPIDAKVPYSDYERMMNEEDPVKRQE